MTGFYEKSGTEIAVSTRKVMDKVPLVVSELFDETLLLTVCAAVPVPSVTKLIELNLLRQKYPAADYLIIDFSEQLPATERNAAALLDFQILSLSHGFQTIFCGINNNTLLNLGNGSHQLRFFASLKEAVKCVSKVNGTESV